MSRHDALLLESEEPFASGASRYLDRHPDVREPQARIYVKFRPDGLEPEISFLALLDTGGPFCILSQDVAELIRDGLTDKIQEVSLHTARGLVRGDLYRHTIHLIAEKGETLAVETNVLIIPEWPSPCFIGYSGLLDRLRFAVDSPTNRFYFGY